MTPTIWAIGRNYLDHAQEMNVELPTQPLVFLKSGACLTQSEHFQLPSFSNDIHHELELAVEVSSNLHPQRVALALDLTARDIQQILKSKGQPWTLAKSFKQSCPISSWINYVDDKWFSELSFSLQINEKLKQRGRTKDMIFNLNQLLDYLKRHFPLQAGDIILTGTPAGVGQVKTGDRLYAEIPGFLQWSLQAT